MPDPKDHEMADEFCLCHEIANGLPHFKTEQCDELDNEAKQAATTFIHKNNPYHKEMRSFGEWCYIEGFKAGRLKGDL